MTEVHKLYGLWTVTEKINKDIVKKMLKKGKAEIRLSRSNCL
jgi:hypothetical protein